MNNQGQANILITNALRLAEDTLCEKVFLFLNSEQACKVLVDIESAKDERIVFILPKAQEIPKCIKNRKTVVHTWSGNQTRFSRIKYAFMQAVLQKVIQPDSKVACVLGPWGKDHLDTITVHDLGLSWSEAFPFDPRSLISKNFFTTVIAVVDIALDIGALGREGKSVGTTFIIGNVEQIMRSSHQAIFNPFKGYPEQDRGITSSEVVESIKELAQLDGAFVISEKGVVEAAGRHLDAVSSVTRQLKGLGSRHRAAASITMYSEAIAVVVSESTGRVTIFDEGKIVAALEPVISTRVV
jgi:diadenylate cyclase